MTSLLTVALALATEAAAAVIPDDFDFRECTYTPAATTFRLFAPPEATVSVEIIRTEDLGRSNATPSELNDKGNHSSLLTPPSPLKMPYLDGLHTVTVPGDLKGAAYVFNIDGRRSVGVGARAVGTAGSPAYVIDPKDTDPDGWEADRRPDTHSWADIIVYELHHRDFSIDPSAPITHKGKYLALTEPAAIEHLKRLGIGAVHILPSFDYGSVDESRPDSAQYNWGYDPVNYNVPEGSYSTNAADPKARIREFKQMVQALHKAGIRVILDVVYNHTFDIPHSNFSLTYPGYYYRTQPDGSYSNGSGCGNETASERPMMRQYIVQSVLYWLREYHIDGFRFDLMGVHDIATMNAVRRAADTISPTILIYGEGWSAGPCALPQDSLAMKANMRQVPRVAAFSDELRDALRGPFDDDAKPAFLAGVPGHEETIRKGIAAAYPWCGEPTQMMAYVSCHDDMCLTDRLRASIPGIKEDEIVRLDLLAQTAVMTSQGIPFILSGEEMLRTKHGVHNSYNAPDSINHLDWTQLQTHPEVFDYYCRLAQLRHQHPAFRLGTKERVKEYLSFLNTPDCTVAYRLQCPDDTWTNIIVALNSNRQPVTIDIPKGQYTIICKDGKINPTGLGNIKGDKLTIPAQSAVIIIGN